jgi:hypothetical protein
MNWSIYIDITIQILLQHQIISLHCRDSTSSLYCCRSMKPSTIFRFVDCRIFTDVSKYRSGFIFRVNQSSACGLMHRDTVQSCREISTFLSNILSPFSNSSHLLRRFWITRRTVCILHLLFHPNDLNHEFGGSVFQRNMSYYKNSQRHNHKRHFINKLDTLYSSL